MLYLQALLKNNTFKSPLFISKITHVLTVMHTDRNENSWRLKYVTSFIKIYLELRLMRQDWSFDLYKYFF